MPLSLLGNLKSRVSRLPLDHDQYGGWLFFFVGENISSKLLSSENTPTEAIHIELSFCKKNWLLFCIYYWNRNIIINLLDVLKRKFDSYSTKYNKLMVIGDLNTEVNLECMKLFCETYYLNSLITVSTCYKNP